MQFWKSGESVTAFRHRSGSGPTIVFLNTLGTDARIWDDVIDALPSSFACLSYDMRGQGVSAVPTETCTIDLLADDLMGLMDHLGLTDIILCGLSLGGQVALAVAARQPGKVRGLILCNTGSQIGVPEDWAAQMATVRKGGLEGIADQLTTDWFSRAFAAARPETVAGCRTMLCQTSDAGYVALCTALAKADLTETVFHIDCPALCIAGANDMSVPPDAMADLSGLIAGAAMVTLQQSGHLPCIDAPQEMAALIRDFVAEYQGHDTRYQTGMAVRRAVLGDVHVDNAEAARTAFDDPFQALITEAAWGNVWASPAIPLRERTMLTLGLLAALGNFDEIPMHIRASARTGASPEDIQQVFQHVAIYAGVPRANRALKLAKKTLAEMERASND